MASSSSTTTEFTLWTRLEHDPEPFEFSVDYTNRAPNLGTLSSLICQHACLQQLNVRPGKVEFFGKYSRNYDREKLTLRDFEAYGEEGGDEGDGDGSSAGDRGSAGDGKNGSKPPRDTLLQDLEATAVSPLVVRFPLSNAPVVIRCNLSTSWFRELFPHSTGLWYLLCEAAENKFETLQPAHTEYFFVYTESNTTPGNRQEVLQIRNAYQLNTLVEEIQPDNIGRRELSLSIRVQGLFTF